METGWIEVFVTPEEYKAEIAKDLLENEGIKVFILNQHDSAYQIFGNFCLYVFEDDESKAVEILKSLTH